MNQGATINKLSIEKIDASEKKWCELLKLFTDASLYQTHAFGQYSKGGSDLEHIILKNGNEIISVAQVRILTLPIIKKGIAYIRWGPLWRKAGQKDNVDNFKLAIDQLVSEYVVKRKLILRIMPNIINPNPKITSILQSYGFKKSKNDLPYKTFYVDISKSLEDIRKNFRKKWRYSLKQAEKYNLKVIQGTNLELYEKFYKIYKEMHSRKLFKETVNIDSFKAIQETLPVEQRMQIFICEEKNKPISALVGTAMGDTGIYLLGGTNKRGLELSASYLVQWETIKWLKDLGIKNYDLGGIDPEGNKGVYIFKKGLGGEETQFIGKFETGKSLASKFVVKLGEKFNK